jgi:hypothetical protein
VFKGANSTTKVKNITVFFKKGINGPCMTHMQSCKWKVQIAFALMKKTSLKPYASHLLVEKDFMGGFFGMAMTCSL